jgi:hypothetical protein
MSRIAFDFHGTLDTHEDMRKLFIKLHFEGCELFIITGSYSSVLSEELKFLPQLPMVPIISILDYASELGLAIKSGVRENIPEHLWWAMKAILCKVHHIHTIVDNDERFREYFGKNHPTMFYTIESARYFLGNKTNAS